MTRYPRDMTGYGPNPPFADWPGGARIAVQFVLNYEEGGENCILHGDAASEAFLSEIVGAAAWPGQRHWNMESIYEYGARVGFWRLRDLFVANDIPVTIYGVATALARSPLQVAAMQDAGWEIASHGLKWVEYKDATREAERADLEAAIKLHTQVTGARPRGWYTGRCSVNTVDLVSEEGGFDYVSDSYADDLPYWREHAGRQQLIIPYTLDANDMRFATPQGFNSGDQFFAYLRDSFDTLYAEGVAGSPKMMSIGLHCRLIGRPGRIAALARFIDHVRSHENVWIARRIDIAEHWQARHPAPEIRPRPSTLSREDFVARFGGVFEHSPWIAERAHAGELGPAHDSAPGLHSALARAFRAASEPERLGVLTAHPDLAGKLAAAKRLTPESTAEQAGAGLDALTDAERARFTELNDAYVAKFGFPFIIAVRGLSKDDILARLRIPHRQSTATPNSPRPAPRSSASRSYASRPCSKGAEMLTLWIGNKNYSSWSLRPWVAMREAGVAFEERLVLFHDTDAWDAYRPTSPNGQVPMLDDDGIRVSDSLAIVEYLAETHPALWPADRAARAFARTAAAAMHSGFRPCATLRHERRRPRVPRHMPDAVTRDLERLSSALDHRPRQLARSVSRGHAIHRGRCLLLPGRLPHPDLRARLPGDRAAAYAARLLDVPAMREWQSQALAEPFRDPPHEAELTGSCDLIEDLRARQEVPA